MNFTYHMTMLEASQIRRGCVITPNIHKQNYDENLAKKRFPWYLEVSQIAVLLLSKL
jgi:hypothetical protein